MLLIHFRNKYGQRRPIIYTYNHHNQVPPLNVSQKRSQYLGPTVPHPGCRASGTQRPRKPHFILPQALSSVNGNEGKQKSSKGHKSTWAMSAWQSFKRTRSSETPMSVSCTYNLTVVSIPVVVGIVQLGIRGDFPLSTAVVALGALIPSLIFFVTLLQTMSCFLNAVRIFL